MIQQAMTPPLRTENLDPEAQKAYEICEDIRLTTKLIAQLERIANALKLHRQRTARTDGPDTRRNHGFWRDSDA